MVIIRKFSFLLTAVLFAALFAGCTKPVDPSQASPFSVYNIKDETRFSLGDKREDIEAVVNDTPLIIVEFEDNIGEGKVYERVDYEDIAFDFDREGVLLGLRIRSNKWKIANGLKVTDSVENVKSKYPQEHLHTYKQNNDIYVSYDENGNSVEFSEKAAFRLRFVIEQYAVKSIFIEKNVL